MAGIPDSVRHRFQRILEDSKGDERFKKLLANGSDENFRWAYQFAYDRAHGKPAQPLEHSGEITSKLVFRFPVDK